jgi:hypothetical protein
VHGLSDTSPDVERVMIEGYRRMSPARKLTLAARASVAARTLHAAGHGLRNPHATAESINREWAAITLGIGPWTERMRYDAMVLSDEYFEPVRQLVTFLDDLNILYAVGGSIASCTHGLPRQTIDADLTVEPFPYKEKLLHIRLTKAEFYADEPSIRDAVANRSSFNVIHLPTMFKIDVFIRKDTPFHEEVFSRRVSAPAFGPERGSFKIVSAEDMILLKLEWYRMGGGTSDRQWNDVQGMIKLQADNLDVAYLRRWSAELGVTDLLEKALQESVLPA